MPFRRLRLFALLRRPVSPFVAPGPGGAPEPGPAPRPLTRSQGDGADGPMPRLWMTLALAVGALVWLLWHGATDREARAGAHAFDGRLSLVARVDGHDAPLPASAVACANCHEPSARPATGDGGPGEAARFAPLLRHDTLVESRPRRGGPPSAFDLPAFCKLLRTGVDPAGVMLPRAMPRYEIDDVRCAQLWRHLMVASR